MLSGQLLQRSYGLKATMVSFRCTGPLLADVADVFFRGKMSFYLLLGLTVTTNRIVSGCDRRSLPGRREQ